MKVIQLKYISAPWLYFNLERLMKFLVSFNWQQECEIVQDYMPPNPNKDTRPTCVIRWRVPGGTGQDKDPNSFRYLRYSGGPKQGYFWDIYGDDFLYPELALMAIHNAHSPTTWELRD